MPNRTTYNLPGLAPDGAVAPDLVKVGNVFFTSGIRGVNVNTGEVPQDPAQQYLNAWHNLAAVVEGAGLSLDNLGLVTNFIDSQDFRAYINPGWLELFPAKDNRPARKTTSYPLSEGVGVELQAFGVIGQRRRCIEVRGLTHRDPLPNAVRIGDYIFTSVIVPWDLSTSEPVVGEDAQTDQCFDNMRIVMEEAGGTIDDVVLQWVYLNDFAYQPYMVDIYLEAWPIGQYQAARKTFRYPMGGQIQIQCIGRVGGQRSNHEIPGHGHHDPIPMGARVGDLYASSGVSGVDPSSDDKLEPVEGAPGQAYFGIRNVRTLAQEGGMSADDIGHLTVLVQDYAEVAAVDKEWCAMFPDPADRPARQIMKMGVQRRSRVQWHMLAAATS
jgi:2-iminobutanoate/2-iminopropanoate deaminase